MTFFCILQLLSGRKCFYSIQNLHEKILCLELNIVTYRLLFFGSSPGNSPCRKRLFHQPKKQSSPVNQLEQGLLLSPFIGVRSSPLHSIQRIKTCLKKTPPLNQQCAHSFFPSEKKKLRAEFLVKEISLLEKRMDKNERNKSRLSIGDDWCHPMSICDAR